MRPICIPTSRQRRRRNSTDVRERFILYNYINRTHMPDIIPHCITRHTLPKSRQHKGSSGPPTHPFWYANPHTGKRIRDRDMLEYIRSIRIPAAYHDVCINPRQSAAVLATGRDAKGNLQYRYHPRTTQSNARKKFRRMLSLSAVIPIVRESLRGGGRGAPAMDSKEEAINRAIGLLSECSFRVGNPKYLKQNKSHGLTNLLVRHYDPKKHTITFQGKTNQTNMCTVHDPWTRRFLQDRARRMHPDERIFSYASQRSDNTRAYIFPADVNRTLRAHGDITAKDFRMWTANVGLLKALSAHYIKYRGALPRPFFDKRRIMRMSLKGVAEQLNHTPAVCRSNYVHPGVYDMYMSDDSAWFESVLRSLSRSRVVSNRKYDDLLRKLLVHLDRESW